jgi:SAM-dependent methyltransferase
MRSGDLPDRPLPARNATTDAAWRQVFEAACAPYRSSTRFSSNWAWHWARGKLARDPVFRGLLERGDLLPDARVVDIGCGQGLIASLLRACEKQAAAGLWPASWPAAPSFTAYHGIELMLQDAARGNAALAALRGSDRAAGISGSRSAEIACVDMREAPIPPCDLVVILDVLHYIDHAAQDALLARMRRAMAPHGRLLLRVGDPARRGGFAVSQWVDWVVTTARGHRVPPTWTRSLADWTALLQGLGFGAVQRVAMSQGTPFANVLLVADLTGAAQ